MAKNSNIIEKELFGELVQVDKTDGLPVNHFTRRHTETPAEAARVQKPPATLAAQQKAEAEAEAKAAEAPVKTKAS